ncbi:MAG: glycosyltransferase [Chloroflexota bacterium]|nr:glycosyltransferase [Chloroflexota bacterium]MDE2897232.1 glycosyltransferase [Chloroflexota bacterium]
MAAYGGYPALVWAAATLQPRPYLTDPNHKPLVAVVIAAHNEAALIGAKVRNVFEQDYAPGTYTCTVVCDGCADDTADAARAAGDDRLQVIELPRQRGKLAAIRAALPHARGEVIAFTDANVLLERDALRHLVAPLADPSVAAVSGAKHIGNGPEATYWRYERWIRARESASGSIAGADGALYAVRATDVDASACAGAADDLLISLRAIRAAGRIVFAPQARAFEAPSPGTGQGFTARTRTTSGALFALASLPELLRAPHRDLWWKLSGHKLLRIATPLAMATGLALLALPRSPAQRRVWSSSLVLSAALAALPMSGRLVVWTRYALLANLAALVGLTRFITRRPIDAWSPARGGERDARSVAQPPLN